MNTRTCVTSLLGLCLASGACFKDTLGELQLSTSSSTSGDSSTAGTTATSGEPTTGAGPGSTSSGETTGTAACGDGVPDPGEGCDDGELNGPGAACKGDCTVNVCGDGDRGPGEGCDDGNTADGDGCSSACLPEICGDGVQQGAEECDDGNMNDADACTNMCTAPRCGDAIVQAGEACDDGDLDDADDCTTMCQKTPRRVFVTSQEYMASLGGVAGADAKCQAQAQAAGLPGTYFAWISGADAASAPAARFAQSTVPYVRVDGIVVADHWSDLIDGSLDAPIATDEVGQPVDVEFDAYTNTHPDGTRKSDTLHCNDWVGGIAQSVTRGNCTVVSTAWTDSGTASCTGSNRLYCFQQ